VTALYIIRHAQAAEPDDLRLPGADLPLLPSGRRQATAVGRRLSLLAPGVVYTSNARRARETGELIAAACDVSMQERAGLAEVDFGQWAGKTYAEIVAADPTARAWFANPVTEAPAGGESLAAAAERVQRFLERLAHGDQERVAVVGHAGSLRLALAQMLGMPLASYWRLRQDCASLSIVTWTVEGPVLERMNDTAHLDGDMETAGEREPA
jgi:broad specificity phosphatase PhoE